MLEKMWKKEEKKDSLCPLGEHCENIYLSWYLYYVRNKINGDLRSLSGDGVILNMGLHNGKNWPFFFIFMNFVMH